MGRSKRSGDQGPLLTYAQLDNRGYETWEKILTDFEIQPPELAERPIVDAITAEFEHVALTPGCAYEHDRFGAYLVKQPEFRSVQNHAAWHSAGGPDRPADHTSRYHHVDTVTSEYFLHRRPIGLLRITSTRTMNAARTKSEAITLDLLTVESPEHLIMSLERKFPFLEESARSGLTPNEVYASTIYRHSWDASDFQRFGSRPRFTKKPRSDV